MIQPEFLSFGKIDGKDAFSELGFALSEGVNTFLAPHQPKAGYSYNWENSNGTEYDLSATVYKEARVFRLKGWLIGESVEDFTDKYNNLLNLLYSPGARNIYIKKFDLSLGAKIKSFSDWSIPAGAYYNGSPCVGAEITLEFDEVMDFVIPEYAIYYGPSPVDPILESQILPLNTIEDTMEITLTTGTSYKNFVVGIQLNKSIDSVIQSPGTGDELDITSEYIQRRVLTVDGHDRKIIVMKTAIPYPTSVIHLITLKND